MLNIYEINTRVWLKELSNKYRDKIRLDNTPEEEILYLKKLGFDAVWLMGVWRSSDKGRAIALNDKSLRPEFLSALPDLKKEDIACSPYSIAGYEPDSSLGGRKGLLNFKELLNKQGMKLILDFVPNHIALDHPWVKTNPEYFINGTRKEMKDNPGMFFSAGDRTILAHGKDPYFPAWPDVVQLNYFNPGTRQAMLHELLKVAQLCDGVRCDMAMLVIKYIQKQIWGKRVFAGNKFSESSIEFWEESIAEVKKTYPDFLFIAEVYWGLESELISLGFDYVYDKTFYDALKETNIDYIRANLTDAGQLANKRLRFIENHDENRAAAVFGNEKSKAAALIMLIAPGAHLLYQGQMEGFTKKLPIQLIRMPREEINREVFLFYENVISNLKAIAGSESRWVLLETFPVWEGNQAFRNFFAFLNQDYLAVINYSGSQSQGYLHLDMKGFHKRNVIFKDLLGLTEYVRNIGEIVSRGFYLDIPPYAFNFFKITGVD